MPPRGAKKGTKSARQYEYVNQSVKDQGKSEDTAEEIAARTVNKERARSGESRTRSRSSVRDPKSPSQRGGERSGTNKAKGRTRDQLYNEAKKLNIEGRSGMNKDQLERAVDRKRTDREGPVDRKKKGATRSTRRNCLKRATRRHACPRRSRRPRRRATS